MRNAKLVQATARIISAWLLAALIPLCGARAELDREGLRALWGELSPRAPEGAFAERPSAEPPFAAGALSDATLSDALAYANFARAVAGLAPVGLREEYVRLAQSGALISAANGFVRHDPPRPEGYPDALYDSGARAAASGNLAAFNWSEPKTLRLAIESFARDDGANASVAGHRRWLLNPRMRETGFGLALDPSGNAYAAMYAFDRSAGAEYDRVCWPAPGAFPAEWMSESMPWSISLNPNRYDLEGSEFSLMIEEVGAGRRFEFDSLGEASREGAFFALDAGRYGDGPALLFRPEIEGGYRQNQRWRVELSGIRSRGGEPVEPIRYEVGIVSLTPIDPADVEIDEPAPMRVGESAALAARVIPDWADDVSLTYRSSDPSVVEIDERGVMTARSEGAARIEAIAANGRRGEVEVGVKVGR